MAEKEISHKFFLTVTLKPLMYQYTADKQYDMTIKQLLDGLKQFDCAGEGYVELTKSFNIHYHLMVDFKTRYKYPQMKFIDYFRGSKMIGKIDVQIPADENKVLTYIKKDNDRTSEMLQMKSARIFNEDRSFANRIKTITDLVINTPIHKQSIENHSVCSHREVKEYEGVYDDEVDPDFSEQPR